MNRITQKELDKAFNEFKPENILASEGNKRITAVTDLRTNTINYIVYIYGSNKVETKKEFDTYESAADYFLSI